MTTINDTYVNALLADSSYVDGLTPNMTGPDLAPKLAGRMTTTLAKYISDNFTVVSQVGGLSSSFDATVWRGNADTPYNGQIYVSMRGTQEGPDFVADGDLALSGLAHAQLADMVNWWLRETTSPTEMAKQIAVDVTVISTVPLVVLQNFVAAADVQGTGVTGRLLDIGIIQSVNGHSLGGYLASAFVRLFGNQQPPIEISTFNSAGFSWPASLNIEHGFSQITQIIGTASGLGNFSSTQSSYFAKNGINVTTNTWDPAGFQQYGTRIGLFQEDLTPQGINNHYMYKLTDLLALGNALAEVETTLDLEKLSMLVGAGSNQMAASYEGLLDGFRRMLMGANVSPTPPGDANANNTGPQPLPRRAFQTNLKDLTDSDAFKALKGNATVTQASSNLATTAKTDFAAFLALNALSPVVISTTDPAAIAALKAANADLSIPWSADNNARLYGDTTKTFDYSDNWYADRAALLQAIVTRNKQDIGGILPGTQNIRYFDAASNTQVLIGAGATNDQRVQYLFGGEAADPLDGKGFADHLYGGAGNDTLDGKGGDDYLEGNAGDDILIGGEGTDTLLGGIDNDTLDGGAGVDILKGGTGTDTYTLRASDSGIDTITDSDGLGSIKVIAADASETTLGMGIIHKLTTNDNTWQSEDKRFTYTTSQEGDGSTTLLISGAGVTARVHQFTSGNLGITLPEAPTAEPAPAPVATTYDLATTAGKAAWRSGVASPELGYHLQNAVQPRPGDLIASAYWEQGLGGNDLIEGGATPAISQTVVRGNGGNDRMYAQIEQDLQAAIEQGETLPGSGSSNYLLDGGEGDDLLVGTVGADVLFGGQGDDTIVGGAGSDLINSDGDVGGIVFAGGASWVTGSNEPLTGQARRLDIVHEGARLYLSPADSTGQRTAYYAYLALQLDMASDIDYQNLRSLTGQDVRNLGYSYEGLLLDNLLGGTGDDLLVGDMETEPLCDRSNV